MTSTSRQPSRVFMDINPWDFRSRNSDWRYVRYFLPRLREWEPQLDLVFQQSRRVTLAANVKTVRVALGRRAGFPASPRTREADKLDAAELMRSGCNVIFSHRGYPVNAGDVPVIWQSSILDPVMTDQYDSARDPAERQMEVAVRHEFFRRAAVVQVSTEAEAARLSQTFPELAGRFVPIPFFLPYLEAAPESQLERHKSDETIEVLFVGNDARRKGLDLLLAAFTSLPANLLQRARLTVISNFDDGKVQIPTGLGSERVTVLRGVPPASVLERMRRSHILVNVARFESYGFIFPEAMSQGMVCIGPDWEVQRELLDYGRAGVTLPCDAEAIRLALARLIDDPEYRYELARNGWIRFRERLHPSVVAKQYAELFDYPLTS